MASDMNHWREQRGVRFKGGGVGVFARIWVEECALKTGLCHHGEMGSSTERRWMELGGPSTDIWSGSKWVKSRGIIVVLSITGLRIPIDRSTLKTRKLTIKGRNHQGQCTLHL